MNFRKPIAAHTKAATLAKTSLLELEMPKTTAFAAFEEQLEAQLAALETQFCDFVTPNSFSHSIGR